MGVKDAQVRGAAESEDEQTRAHRWEKTREELLRKGLREAKAEGLDPELPGQGGGDRRRGGGGNGTVWEWSEGKKAARDRRRRRTGPRNGGRELLVIRVGGERWSEGAPPR